MAQQIKVPATSSDDLNSIPTTHMGRENWLLQTISDLQVHTDTFPTHKNKCQRDEERQLKSKTIL